MVNRVLYALDFKSMVQILSQTLGEVEACKLQSIYVLSIYTISGLNGSHIFVVIL